MNKFSHSARHAGFNISLLALSISAGAYIPFANADEAGATEHVNVVGQAVSLDKALKEQRASESVSSVVHADGIAKLPDDNAAEALQRLPGLATERDQGEGRFVSVRGISPDLNNVTINGTLVPAPESGRRAVALDVLPSELVQSLSVVKTLTPDMDANSLGGTIEVESLSAFDHKGLFYTASGEASHDKNIGKDSPKISGAASNTFSLGNGTNNFGVAAAISWQERDFGSDNVETGGAWDFEEGAKLEEFEMRDYQITRERLGAGLNFDYKPDQTSQYYLRTLHSEFKDTETRNAAIVEFEDALTSGDTGTAEVKRELKDREETQEIQSLVVGGERSIEFWTIAAQAGHSQSSEDTPLHIPGASFEGSDALEDIGYSNTKKPRLTAPDAFYQAGNFSLDEIEQEKQYAEDTENNVKLDLTRDYEWNGNAARVKFGTKLSRREKANDLESWAFEDFDDAGFTDDQLSLTQFSSGAVDYNLNRFGPGISANGLNGVIAALDRADYYNEIDSRINDYSQQEDTNAAYVMNTLELGDWQLLTGVRYEGTDFEAQGTEARTTENDEGDDVTTFNATNASRSDDYFLPGLHARYSLDKETQLRAAWTNTVVRPTFEQTAPGIVIEGDEAEFGNPDLDPLESSNIDVGVERYIGRAGVVSAYVFYKDISNFSYATDLAGTGAWTDYDEALTFANGDNATLYGLELAFSRKLDRLPSPWNGLIVGANATFTDSDASIKGFDADEEKTVRRDISLPNQADTVGNLMLGWENDVLSMRLSANYKSESLYEVASVTDADHDLYMDGQTFVDLSAQYAISKGLWVNFEAQNMTDEPYYVYTGRSAYNAQYEEYGPTYKLGLTYTQF